MKNYYSSICFSLCLFYGGTYAQNNQSVNMGAAINSEFAENGPKISPDGKTLYFWRWRDQDEKSKSYGHDIWKSNLDGNGAWAAAVKMEKPLNTGSYNAVECVGRNGNTLLLHGAFKKGKSDGTGYSISSQTKQSWSVPQKLDIKDLEKMQLGKYSNGTMSNDGTILVLCFSEVKDSEENDFYVCFKQPDGSWSRPKHMGKGVNSEFREASPFISADGANLYFSSNRPGGIGCFDIYRATRLDNTWENWTAPQNLGRTVNSDVCDIHFSIDANEEYAYLGTYHNSVFGGEDIVKVKLNDSLKPVKNIVIVASDSMLVQTQTGGNALPVNQNSVSTANNTENTGSFLTRDFSANNFIIYPNPTDENFFLELTGTYTRDLLVTIIDVSGKIITSERIDRLDGMYTKRFDVGGYAKGMYFVTVNDGMSVASKRLVIK